MIETADKKPFHRSARSAAFLVFFLIMQTHESTLSRHSFSALFGKPARILGLGREHPISCLLLVIHYKYLRP